MKIGMWVIVLLLVVFGLLAVARGTACENYCSVLYSEQKEICKQKFGENGENPDSTKYASCLAAVEANHERCMKNCVDEP
ncbi:MAG: hypothetical protein ACI4SG_01225 [Oligosphaeraceae bacterium]